MLGTHIHFDSLESARMDLKKGIRIEGGANDKPINQHHTGKDRFMKISRISFER
jgi:hypothetical protein